MRLARAILGVACGLAMMAAPGQLLSTTVPPPPPHHPEQAFCTMSALVRAIDRRDHAILSPDLKIVSEQLGRVTPDELDRFFDEFAGDGGSRRQPLELTAWGILHVNAIHPLYVVSMRRGSSDTMHWSAWLIQFQSDRISLIRRADELWPFTIGANHFFYDRSCPEARPGG